MFAGIISAYPVMSIRLNRIRLPSLPNFIVGPPSWSVRQVIPGHERQLDGDKRQPDREQVPAQDGLPAETVFEQDDRQPRRGDAGGARRLAPMREEPLVEDLAEKAHVPVSRVKI